ncbi:FecR domain-containing protein [Mangrovibacterium lignilyticum]|uniref:FecR domain-containing protein n=1 Tax=Mangrovibacterium lignilyticum TaxID=2668052 RepID=UPI0013CFC4F5|nr:FecR domain-containing protein [Mangrovibacterium lignilyticum]
MEELILKYLQGEASYEEGLRVLEWLQADPENFRSFEELRDAWFAAGIIRNIPEINVEQQYNKLHNKLNPAQSKTIRVTFSRLPEWLKIAAVFVLAFLMGAMAINLRNNHAIGSPSPYVLEAPYGAKIKMDLGDGTRVWLNAGSKLSYSNSFNSNNRNVTLSGEAYFQVAKNKKLPFIVQAGQVKVKAVGTAFNVKAYADEDKLEATLVEGTIELSQGGDKQMLMPRQMITIDRPNALTGKMKYQIATNVNTDIYTSWIGKRWIFERENMLDFAKKLERRYDVRISIEDERLTTYKITGSIEQQTLGQLLSALQLTIPLSYKIQDDEVVLTINEKLKREYEPLIKK